MEAVPGPCSDCDHDPACGYASVMDDEGTDWLCHADDHSCYKERLLYATRNNPAVRPYFGLGLSEE